MSKPPDINAILYGRQNRLYPRYAQTSSCQADYPWQNMTLQDIDYSRCLYAWFENYQGWSGTSYWLARASQVPPIWRHQLNPNNRSDLKPDLLKVIERGLLLDNSHSCQIEHSAIYDPAKYNYFKVRSQYENRMVMVDGNDLYSTEVTANQAGKWLYNRHVPALLYVTAHNPRQIIGITDVQI